MDKVLITYGWNRMAYIVNRSLSSKKIQTFVGDVSKIHMNRFSKYSYKTFQYPSFYENPKLFVEFIVDFCIKNNIKYLIPTHEEGFIFSKYKDLLDEKNIKYLLPDFELIKILHKKDESSKLAQKLGIPIPNTIYPKNIDEVKKFFKEYKNIVIKYLETNSAKGVFYPKRVEEIYKFEKDIGKFLVQEKVEGVGYGVSMLFKDGKIKAKFTHRRLQEKTLKGGTSTLRESTKNELLEEWAEKLLKSVNYNGVAMVEFKFNELNKKGYFIEINPRFWGSLALPYISGVDFPYLMFKLLKNEDFDMVNNYKMGVKVKWLLGSFIGFFSYFIKGKFNSNILLEKADGYDDWWRDDKKVFLGECLYYGNKFFNSFEINPTKNSMVKIDEI